MPWIVDELRTERLLVRCPHDYDKPTVRQLVTDPAAREFLGGPISDEELAGLEAATFGERWGAFIIGDAERNQAIGNCSLSRERGELEVSYSMLPSHWGRGLATEAVQAVLGWGWANTDDGSIIAVTQRANERSLRLLDRLGFVAEQEFVEFDAPQVLLGLERP